MLCKDNVFRGNKLLLVTGVIALLVLLILSLRPKCDYLISNVSYCRGDVLSAEVVNIGITAGRISYVGSNRISAKIIIPGDGLILTPGLIDVNSCGWLSEDAAKLKVMDGITTFLNAHGDSFRSDAKRIKASRRLNYATSVGLIPVFANHLTQDQMFAALEDSLRYGAYTISLSPEYTKETTPEIIRDLAEHFARQNVLFTFHLRYSSAAQELEGVQEAIDCAVKGNPVHLLHITSTGAAFHPEEAKRMIDAAVQSGMQISYDFYPYTAWASSIHRARFQGDWQERYQVDFSKVRILGEGELTPRRFEELKNDSKDSMVIVESIPQSTVDYFATNTTCPIGTDSEANYTTTHPRGAGSFTKFITDYVDTGKVEFGQAIHRFSTLAAKQFSPYIPELAKRGEIKVGYAADLVLWDREKIKSNANFFNPHQPSSGVVAVFVNGAPVVLGGKPVERVAPGKHLKGSWAK